MDHLCDNFQAGKKFTYMRLTYLNCENVEINTLPNRRHYYSIKKVVLSPNKSWGSLKKGFLSYVLKQNWFTSSIFDYNPSKEICYYFNW